MILQQSCFGAIARPAIMISAGQPYQMYVAPKSDRVAQPVGGDVLDSEALDVRERQLGFVPTQPDLMLSFTDFFTTSVPVVTAAALASGEASDGKAAPAHEPDLGVSSPGQLSRPMLMRLDGTELGELFSLEQSDVVIGRGPKCGIRVYDDSVSDVHASISRSDGVWHVRDLGSSNGTLLNGRRVNESQQLRDGALIRLAPGVSFVFQRINARHEAALRHLFEGSCRDSLTGVHNRRYVDERLCEEVAFAVRHRHPLSLVVMGVDGFRQKLRNGTGDVVLQQLVDRVRPVLRVEDVFGRYGRSEFALVLRSTEAFTAGAIAERLRQAVQEVGTVSAGCAFLAECADPVAASLTSLAKQRQKEAAAKGGNRVVIG
ncbi:MAG TPA: GGDEF domain-containing protein [Polyangiaceae bacterium]